MKKIFTTLAFSFLCLVNFVNAQTSTTTAAPQTSILGSYRATNDFDVYPYYSIAKATPTAPAQPPAGNNLTTPANLIKVTDFVKPEPYIDPSIHFKIKKGTEFYVSKTETANGNIVGYVIEVWDFDTNQEKEAFYAALPTGIIPKSDKVNKSSIISLPADSLKLNPDTKKYEISNQQFEKANQHSSASALKDKDYRIMKTEGEYGLQSIDGNSPYAPFAQLKYVNSWGNDHVFFVSASDFASNTMSVYPSTLKFTWGFLTLPLKLRFDNNKDGRFNFEQNLNFGLTLGAKQQLVSHEDVSINYLLGVSVVNATLNNATAATPEVPATSTTSAIPAKEASPATSAPALSVSLGSMFQYNRFQIGLFLGKDFVGENSSKFSFQGRNWLGIAIGVSLFGEGQTTAGGQQQK